jgi:hypothetical protein
VSFLKGSVTFTRFRHDLPKPKNFSEDPHLAALRSRALGRNWLGVDTLVGWSAGESVLDEAFTELKNVYPDHLAVDLWTQTNKLPGDLLHAYYTADLRALSANNPSGYPSAKQKREARESARDRLEEEARDGRFRKRKCVPVLWDAVRNEVFLGSTSAATAEKLERLFQKTFGSDGSHGVLPSGHLRAITAGELAVRLFPAAEHERLSGFVPGTTPEADGPGWAKDSVDFLGNEFLLWLWFFAEQHGDTLQLPDGSEVTFMFSGGVKVDDPRGQTGHGTLNSRSAVRLPEAKAAVRAGKLPRKAALTLVHHDDQYSFVLAAETLAVTSAKLPPPGEDVNGRAREEHRLQAVRDLAELVEAMFEAFLTRRLSPGWSAELREIQQWLARGGRVAA